MDIPVILKIFSVPKMFVRRTQTVIRSICGRKFSINPQASFDVNSGWTGSPLDEIKNEILENVLAFEKGPKKNQVLVDGSNMNLNDLMILSDLSEGNRVSIEISQETMQRLERSRSVIEDIVHIGDPVYGINTGFGLMSHTNIEKNDLRKLQQNLIRSHASGVGTPLEPKTVRRIMALRINVLARGHSGLSLSTFSVLVAMFNAGLTPEVPCQGTVGASGDLAPLAHIALGAMGEGLMHDANTNTWGPADEMLARYDIKPAVLKAKDGLSLVNGTQFITGVGSEALENSIRACQVAQPIMALSLVSLHGHINAFDARVHNEARPHAGAIVVAECIRNLVPPESHLITPHDVQDAYSLRCTPAVHGPTLEMLARLKTSLTREMNTSTDNPLIFAEDANCPITGKPLPKVVSAGNFHGEYPAKALDTLALYVGELGRASAARIAMLVDPARSRGLQAFIGTDAGLDSGFMCWELTAAALDAENRTLSMPASAETNNTGAGKEDHVSMGGFSARKARQVVENVQKIQAIELLIATHAIHQRERDSDGPFQLPPKLRRLHKTLSAMSPPMESDRYLKRDFNEIFAYISSEMAEDRDLVMPML